MSNRRTRCPQCQVPFAVQQLHLDAANGLVRCGTCLTVFDAREHAEGEWQEEADNPIFDISTEIDLAPDLSELPDIDDELDTLGDEIIDQLIGDQPTPEPPAQAPQKTQEQLPQASVTEPPQASVTSTALPATDEIDSTSPGPETADIALIEEPAPAPEPEAEPEPKEIQQQQLQLPPPDTQPTRTGQPKIDQPPELTPLAEQLLLETGQTRGTGWGRFLGSLAILAIGGLGILAQYVWFHSSELSLNLKYRPLLEPFCQQLDCPLTELRDLSRIKPTNLVIRAHPEQAGAISVDLLLQNIAAYEQRFPSLILVFSNLQGAPVAQRKFSPREYLQGELKGARMMPRNQQIHISLDLVDPGPDALNYQVRLSD